MNSRKTLSPQILAGLLLGFGVIDLLALVAVVMPGRWIELGHRWAGLGELPDGPIVGYLARSTSCLYALHGWMLVAMSRDVRRYWPLIRFLAATAMGHGLIMFVVDWWEQMPIWWRIVEGPVFVAQGAFVLWLMSRTRIDPSDGQLSVE